MGWLRVNLDLSLNISLNFAIKILFVFFINDQNKKKKRPINTFRSPVKH